MSASAPPLAADLAAGRRRLTRATIRARAPAGLQVASVQRWPPEEVVRTLAEAEIAARDAATRAARRNAAGFPGATTREDVQVGRSSVPRPTCDNLASLAWVRAAEHGRLVGPPGTGKRHLLVGCGLRSVEQGLRARYCTAAELVETLSRSLADTSVGRVIDGLLRADLVLVEELGVAPLDEVGTQPWSGSSPPPTHGAAWGWPATGPSRRGGASCRSRPRPLPGSTASCTTPWSWSHPARRSGCGRPAREEVVTQHQPEPQGRGLLPGHNWGLPLGH